MRSFCFGRRTKGMIMRCVVLKTPVYPSISLFSFAKPFLAERISITSASFVVVQSAPLLRRLCRRHRLPHGESVGCTCTLDGLGPLGEEALSSAAERGRVANSWASCCVTVVGTSRYERRLTSWGGRHCHRAESDVVCRWMSYCSRSHWNRSVPVGPGMLRTTEQSRSALKDVLHDTSSDL